MTHLALAAALMSGSYLLGSLPFGLWLTQRVRGIDIRTLGSGNIGATNVARVCGPRLGAAVFGLDVAKGLLPPLAVAHFSFAAPWQILAALLAVVGHTYSVWLGFQGGKGIATGLGALLGIAPPVALGAFCLFLTTLLVLRRVSLASIVAALSLPVLMPLLYPGDTTRLGFALCAGLLGVYKHRANIARLRAGTEPKISLFGRSAVQNDRQ